MTKIIAHRGARSIAPENTIAAAELARLIGADLWETDVSVTRDGHLVLFHDDHLLRTTNALKKFPNHKSFRLDAFDLAQIQSLDAGTVFIEKDPFGEIAAGNISPESLESFKGEKIPTLEDALNYTQKTQFPVNLELKEQTYGYQKQKTKGKYTHTTRKNNSLPKMVVDIISKMQIDPALIIISSFNHEWLKEVEILFPEIEIQALMGDEPEHKTIWTDLFSGKCCFCTYNLDSSIVNIQQIEKIKEVGKKINLFTVNDKGDMMRYINAGVDGLFTDYPQVMKML